MKVSMRRKCLQLVWVVLATSISASCARGQDYSGYDLSTIEGVNAAREAKLGKPLDRESKGCVVIPKELPDVILLGSFAYDLGCELEGAIIGKREVPAGEDISKTALAHLGWQQANAEGRNALALKWVRYGLLAFNHPLMEATEDFKNQTFQTPQASANEKGQITVSVWVQRPSGMSCERIYDKFNYRFLTDGAFIEKRLEKSFSVPCRQPG